MPVAYIGLGSNIDPIQNLPAAADLLLSRFPGICFSTVFKTAARDLTNQPDFFNAVAEIRTHESPDVVHTQLKEIEAQLGKHVTQRFGPRTIDLDLLLYGNEAIHRPDLTVPHPRMHERRFVLEPLCELIDPEALHPTLKQSWRALLATVRDQEAGKTGMALGEEH